MRGVVGGLMVVAFSLIGESVAPKAFAGLFASAPSVAIAGLALTVEGVVEEVKLFDPGTRKDFVERLLRAARTSSSVTLVPSRSRIGWITKRDDITITGAKAKREESDVILAREPVRGQETFFFRDNKWQSGMA